MFYRQMSSPFSTSTVSVAPGGNIAGEDAAGDKRLYAALQVAAERTRAVERVIAALDDERLCSVRDIKLEALVGKSRAQPLDHDVDDAVEVNPL